jgi:hypothetical protein
MMIKQRRAIFEGARLYAIVDTGYVAADRVLAVAGELVRGGVDVLQFRAKGWPRSEIVNFGRELRAIIPPIDAPVPGPLFTSPPYHGAYANEPLTYVAGCIGVRYKETSSWLGLAGSHTDVVWFFNPDAHLINVVVEDWNTGP